MPATLALRGAFEADVARYPVLDAIEAALDEGRRDEAAALCLRALSAEGLPVFIAANLVRSLGLAQAPEAAALETDLIAQVRARAARRPGDAALQINLGRLLCGLGRADEAFGVLTAHLPKDPMNRQGVMALTVILLDRGQPDEVLALWQPLFAATPTEVQLPFDLARMMAMRGHSDHASRLLDQAAPLWKGNRSEFDFVAAAIRGQSSGVPQASMATALFDRLAAGYEANLAALGNRGPRLVARLLDRLALPRTAGLAVLDAGCGTGLCGALLRPYARLLCGVDVAPRMLAQAERKAVYDRLGRADIGSRATLPAGPFDLVVSSDVLVYFGDLGPALANLAAVTCPGGWLVATLEWTEDARGWVLDPNGRYRHDPAYLAQALQTAGFAAPKVRLDGILRYEFDQPVRAFAVAAQRAALAFAPPDR
jgi:predicted TPR repeat methyltransferase